jgi:predicted solute-binding protein
VQPVIQLTGTNMKQLQLPLTTNHAQRITHKLQQAIQYAKEHPDEVMLALMTILLLDIEDDLDDVSK